MPVEYLNEEDRGEPLRLTRDEIDRETNVSTLFRWSDALAGKIDDITAQIEAHVLTEIEDDDWLIPARDALSFAKMGFNRIQRRLPKLGVGSEDQEQLARIREANLSLKATLVKSKSDCAIAAAAREILSDETYGALAKRAGEILGASQEVALAA